MFLFGVLQKRCHLGHLVPGKDRQGVEIGTHRGVFAEELMRSWEGHLTCIDPWDTPPGYDEQHAQLADTNGNREEDYAKTQSRLNYYLMTKRVRLLQMTSEEAAPRFEEATLDLVYLDGDHREEMVRKDLDLWWPKLKTGGVMAGHDIISPGEPNGGWARHVQKAMIEFAYSEGLDVNLIVEKDGLPWSFYLIKE